MINATSETFQSEVLDAKGTVLVDFWASWCGPCKMIAPILEEIAAERTDVKIVKVNVDEQMELAQQYKVSGIPTLMVFKDGTPAATSVGLIPKEKILSYL
ncbi:MAG: thioredoxin [Eubacteriales bacterium]|nr:thioredoxin [Eubacteriales bacterium]